MTEQSQNTVFRNSSFLQGQNGEYIERLQARYAESPASVDRAGRPTSRASTTRPTMF